MNDGGDTPTNEASTTSTKKPQRRSRKVTGRAPTGDGLEDMAAFLEEKAKETGKK